MTSDEQQTPLHFAARNDAVNSVKALVQAKANKEAQDHKKRTPLFLAAVLSINSMFSWILFAWNRWDSRVDGVYVFVAVDMGSILSRIWSNTSKLVLIASLLDV